MISMFAGKKIYYDGDTINVNSKVKYQDQNGNTTYIDMKKFVKLCEKRKEDLFQNLARDIKSNELAIGFPIIVALNELAQQNLKETMSIIQTNEDKYD